jgi:hypothetical protein
MSAHFVAGFCYGRPYADPRRLLLRPKLRIGQIDHEIDTGVA